MNKTEAQQYDAFVDSSPQGTLFHKTWWLDATAPDHYTVLSVKKSGELLAAWPVTAKKLAGCRLLLPPPLTPRLGILLSPSRKARYADQLSDEIDYITELTGLLPKRCFFCQRFSAGFTNWLPLYWAGFRQTTRYTYRIEDLSDLNKVWENMRYGTKRKIAAAQKHGIKVVTDRGLEKLLDLNEMTFKRQKLPLPYSREYVRKIDEACAKNAGRKMFFAVDEADRVHAAVYLIYDRQTAYYLLGGGDPSLNTCGAHFLALWEAIRFASTVSHCFDFEGSMHKNIEPVFRGFGGVQTPYMEISRGSLLMRSAYAVLRTVWEKGGIVSRFFAWLLR